MKSCGYVAPATMTKTESTKRLCERTHAASAETTSTEILGVTTTTTTTTTALPTYPLIPHQGAGAGLRSFGVGRAPLRAFRFKSHGTWNRRRVFLHEVCRRHGELRIDCWLVLRGCGLCSV